MVGHYKQGNLIRTLLAATTFGYEKPFYQQHTYTLSSHIGVSFSVASWYILELMLILMQELIQVNEKDETVLVCTERGSYRLSHISKVVQNSCSVDFFVKKKNSLFSIVIFTTFFGLMKCFGNLFGTSLE